MTKKFQYRKIKLHGEMTSQRITLCLFCFGPGHLSPPTGDQGQNKTMKMAGNYTLVSRFFLKAFTT